ncbi:MAG: glutamate--tRNA ligase [Syntrophomonadaceae bacterium]
MKKIRVRFAPSPTGSLHIGGARTALFNWLFARHNSGDFILRLEDTDTLRSTSHSAQAIIEDLKWLGLDWDEGPDIGGNYGPYKQSERLHLYKKYINQLIDEGKAYYCFCSQEQLLNDRKIAQSRRENYKYSGRCRSLSPEQINRYLEQGLKPVVRLAVPGTGTTVVHDLVRGDVEFSNDLLDDFIIAKSDGWPTYNFAVVVDDYTMRISHVIRAEEHLSNTPKQIFIYEALGFEKPHFAHVSMILAPDRSKLSKRHGAVSVREFQDRGYLKDALVNYLGLLGWSPGADVDLMSRDQMIEQFSLKDVSKSAAIYDIDKLLWMNGHYMAKSDPSTIASLLREKALDRGWLTCNSDSYFLQVINLVKDRAKTLVELLESAQYFFEEIQSYEDKGLKKYFLKGDALELLASVLEIIAGIPEFNAEAIEKAYRAYAAQNNIKAAALIHPTRLAVTGVTATPGIFEVMEVLGRDKCINRIKKALEYIATIT